MTRAGRRAGDGRTRGPSTKASLARDDAPKGSLASCPAQASSQVPVHARPPHARPALPVPVLAPGPPHAPPPPSCPSGRRDPAAGQPAAATETETVGLSCAVSSPPALKDDASLDSAAAARRPRFPRPSIPSTSKPVFPPPPLLPNPPPRLAAPPLAAAVAGRPSPTMSAPQQPLSFNDVFEDEDVDEPKSVHHIRANSSIMQLKKILGEPARPAVPRRASMPPPQLALTPSAPAPKSPTAVKSVSSSPRPVPCARPG